MEELDRDFGETKFQPVDDLRQHSSNIGENVATAIGVIVLVLATLMALMITIAG